MSLPSPDAPTRPGRPSLDAWLNRRDGDGTIARAADTAFLQKRLATLGKVMFTITMLGVCLRGIEEVSSYGISQLTKPSFAWNLLGNASFGVLWLSCSRRIRTAPYLLRVENICLFVACVAYSVLGTSMYNAAIADVQQPSGDFLSLAHTHNSMLILLVLTYAVVIRAAVIPSSARRTRWLTGLLGIPLVFISTHGYGPATDWSELAGHALRTSVWWTFTVLLCSVVSTTIYGLRRKVLEAEKLGQYTLEEKLGEGGMGMVFRASHAMLRRPTAVKLLRPDMVAAVDLARFEREVRMTARLSHPNTVTIYDYGRTQDDIFYYAMELLEGANLGTLVRCCGPQSPARVVHILERIADALSEAHESGLIHRDIKPSNIVLCSRGGQLDVPKVVDFGLVLELEETRELPLTRSGQVLGTPLYMPPEAITAPETVDGRSDLYSLGAVGYFLLTGEHVFKGSELIQICYSQINEQPIPPSERRGGLIPAALEEIILSCLAKDPASRPQSAAELRDRLSGCGDVPAWAEDEAKAWWKKHGDALPGGQSQFSTLHDTESTEAMTVRMDYTPLQK